MYGNKKEIWKKVPGFSKYKISNMGNIKSYHKYSEGYIMSQSDDKDGYQKVTLTKDGKEYTRRIHILVAQAFIENELNLPVVNHVDGIKDNNVVSNLRWSTVRENTIHGYVTGLNNNFGNQHHHSQMYEVRLNGTLFACFDNTFQLEHSLKTSRGVIKEYIDNNKLLYDELEIIRVDNLPNKNNLNLEIIKEKPKGVINPISVTHEGNVFYYVSVSKCARLNGWSREGITDRLNDGRIYKGKYFISKISQLKFLLMNPNHVNKRIGKSFND